MLDTRGIQKKDVDFHVLDAEKKQMYFYFVKDAKLPIIIFEKLFCEIHDIMKILMLK
jgi:hypothetical protein